MEINVILILLLFDNEKNIISFHKKDTIKLKKYSQK